MKKAVESTSAEFKDITDIKVQVASKNNGTLFGANVRVFSGKAADVELWINGKDNWKNFYHFHKIDENCKFSFVERYKGGKDNMLNMLYFIPIKWESSSGFISTCDSAGLLDYPFAPHPSEAARSCTRLFFYYKSGCSLCVKFQDTWNSWIETYYTCKQPEIKSIEFRAVNFNDVVKNLIKKTYPPVFRDGFAWNKWQVPFIYRVDIVDGKAFFEVLSDTNREDNEMAEKFYKKEFTPSEFEGPMAAFCNAHLKGEKEGVPRSLELTIVCKGCPPSPMN